MRVRKKDQSNLVKVGLFIAGLTVVLMIMIMSIGKENSVFDKKVDIRALVGNVSALKQGSYVELKGIRIGTVSSINIVSEDEVEIVMTILDREAQWIKKDSKISISTAGLVGDKYVEIYNGTKEAPKFDPEKDVLISEDMTDIKKILNKGETIANTTAKIMTKLDHILEKLGEGETIVDTMKTLNRASHNLETVTRDLKDAKMGQMVTNVNASMGNINKSTASLSRILDRVEKGPGTVNSLIYDESVHDDLRALLGGAQRNKVIKYFIRESIKNSERKQVPYN
ncbi:MlaD family protein [Peredibacter starrii]|uniref:MlaD family protein n=1 Tax=Peredibacter starrii TaxID=28202 RepID=A0AAX4HPN7_9BACT|nr:MlaD family protein [Peredibacter starrii]WPU64929.1 MlaD family protein [Peredibacter starrii]